MNPLLGPDRPPKGRPLFDDEDEDKRKKAAKGESGEKDEPLCFVA